MGLEKWVGRPTSINNQDLPSKHAQMPVSQGLLGPVNINCYTLCFGIACRIINKKGT